MNIPSCVQQAISLKDKNWFRVGGLAEFFANIQTIEELKESLQFAKDHDYPITILGSGANVLISDEGIKGLTIHLNLKDISIVEDRDEYAYVEAGAGLMMENLITWGIQNHLLGLEEFSGIPSTVGGALYINLHYFKFLIADFMVGATLLDLETHEVINVDTLWFNYKYDYSKIFEKKHIILSGIFKLKKATALESMYALGRSHEIIRHRRQRYPYEYTCGSFFRNFYENEVVLVSKIGKKLIYAGYYLDQVGAKGTFQIGGASVSHQHANMIVTSATATASDVVLIARLMQEKVYQKFGILLQPECELLGFEVFPLHQKI